MTLSRKIPKKKTLCSFVPCLFLCSKANPFLYHIQHATATTVEAFSSNHVPKRNPHSKFSQVFKPNHQSTSRNTKHARFIQPIRFSIVSDFSQNGAALRNEQNPILIERLRRPKKIITSTVTRTSRLMTTPRGGGSDESLKKKTTIHSLSKKILAEAIGTYLIVLLGCGTVSAAIFHGAQAGLGQIAIVWGLAVTLAIYATASISGAHLNPAISLALAMIRPGEFSWRDLLPYSVAQCGGAALAGATNYVLFREEIARFESAKGVLRGGVESVISASAFGEYWGTTSIATAFLAEVIGTALLSFSIFSLTNRKNDSIPKGAIPPMIGATVASLISVIAPLTQAGFNPARDFGPRIVTLFTGWGRDVAMKGWWLYVLGPLVGAPIGAFIADRVLWEGDE